MKSAHPNRVTKPFFDESHVFFDNGIWDNGVVLVLNLFYKIEF